MTARIERDAGRHSRSKARETPRPAIRADHDDAWMAARLESEDRATVERAPAPGDRVSPRHREIRLRALPGGIACRSARECRDHSRPAQDGQPPGCRNAGRPVTAG